MRLRHRSWGSGLVVKRLSSWWFRSSVLTLGFGLALKLEHPTGKDFTRWKCKGSCDARPQIICLSLQESSFRSTRAHETTSRVSGKKKSAEGCSSEEGFYPRTSLHQTPSTTIHCIPISKTPPNSEALVPTEILIQCHVPDNTLYPS